MSTNYRKYSQYHFFDHSRFLGIEKDRGERAREAERAAGKRGAGRVVVDSGDSRVDSRERNHREVDARERRREGNGEREERSMRERREETGRGRERFSQVNMVVMTVIHTLINHNND